MKMSASIKSQHDRQETMVDTNGVAKTLAIPPKASGMGSSINGGELLLLSLATCFCNDIYREAAKRNITVSEVDVICSGEFGGEGEPGFNFTYKAEVIADAPAAAIEELIRHTDRVAEVHSTLRQGLSISLKL